MQASVKLVAVLVAAACAALAHAQDRLTPQDTGIRLETEQARARQTPKTDFGSVVKQGTSATADQNLSAGAGTPLSLSPPPPPAGPVPLPYPNTAAREPGSLEIPNINAKISGPVPPRPTLQPTPVPLPQPILRPAPTPVPAAPAKIDAITIKQK